MEEINKAYATFEERDRIASLGGGVDKIEKQHESGKMTARERIEMLLDKGTFVELDKLMVHRCTNYGMDKNKIPGDGIVSGYGKVDGRQVFVYAYDFTVYGGSLSASNAKKIVKVQQLALKNGAPIIALIAAYMDYLMNLEENNSGMATDNRPISKWKEFGLHKGVLRI